VAKLDNDKLNQVVADSRRAREQGDKGYRERALKMYPHICGRCCREFDRSNLQELTVHHRDHNHDNNPRDGNNWELLCLYCHDHEHAKYLDTNISTVSASNELERQHASGKPFANLKDLLKDK